ncbi:MAG: hypothetical protein FJ214_10265 [Ignavibacteria bacterium]|nr:hypothetical protein [Ignavibacteria bacterium]
MTHKFFFFVLILFNILFSQVIGQNKDSLIYKRNVIKAELTSLKLQIDSLRKTSASLTEKIGKTNLEIEGLFTKIFGKEYGVRIFNKQIWKGMSEMMLKTSWGVPDKIEKNIEKWGVFTQWYYGKITFFFRDSKLTDWEEKK